MKNNKNNLSNVFTVILAAGKGKRINANRNRNKVTYEVAGKPMLLRTVQIVKNTGVENILIVVGFAKDSILRLLDKGVNTVEQRKRLGTGHALKVALKKIPKNAEDVLVLNGDDSFLYSSDILNKLLIIHKENNSKLTFLTMEIENPYGLGRVLRDKNGNVKGIIEEKDATEKERKIKEINPACYLFACDFLRKYINKIPKSKVSGEYYLVSLVEMAVKNSEKIETLKLKNLKWRGVNTMDELKQAEKFLS